MEGVHDFIMKLLAHYLVLSGYGFILNGRRLRTSSYNNEIFLKLISLF